MTEPTAELGRDPDRPAAAGGADEATEPFFVLRLGRALYALPGALVQQVAPAVAPVRVPGASRRILGVVQLRERILAVVDAHAILGVSRAEGAAGDERPRLVAVDLGQTPFALLADGVLGVHEVPRSSVRELAGDAGTSSFAAGTLELEAGVATVLRPEALKAAVTGR